MAVVEQVWEGLRQEIITAMTAGGLSPLVGKDWPTKNILDTVSKGGVPAISIFDVGGVRNRTRNTFLSPALLPFNGTPGGVLTAGASTLPTGSAVTIVGSATPLINDCFFLALDYLSGAKTLFAEHINTGSDTLIAAMTALTVQINLIDDITAVFDSVNTITVTNNTATNYLKVRTGVVNIGSYTQEIYRPTRKVQITLWTASTTDRQTYGTILEQLFANMEVTYGFQLSDQTWCRIMIVNDVLQKDMQLNDIYRRDFWIDCDYPVLNTVKAWLVEDIQQTFAPE